MKHKIKYSPVEITENKMKKWNTIDNGVQLYQVNMTMVNCIYVQLKLSMILIVHRENVAIAEMNVTQISNC